MVIVRGIVTEGSVFEDLWKKYKSIKLKIQKSLEVEYSTGYESRNVRRSVKKVNEFCEK